MELIKSIFGKAPADTVTEATQRELSILDKMEAAIPIYQAYKARKNNLQAAIKIMQFGVTDVQNPKVSMRYADYTSEAKFKAAVDKVNAERAEAKEKEIEKLEKELRELDAQTEANLLSFWL